jgi:superfamily II DNA or RNA helicase
MRQGFSGPWRPRIPRYPLRYAYSKSNTVLFSPPGGIAVTAALRKTLRPYQARLITDVCRSDGHVLVEQPTGSGKTMQVVTLVAMQLGRRFSHAVIAAPQQQIEEGFTDLDYRYVGFPAC